MARRQPLAISSQGAPMTVERRRNGGRRSYDQPRRDPNRLLTPSEIPFAWHMSALSVRREIVVGRLRAWRIGRDYRISGQDYVEFLRSARGVLFIVEASERR
jgi:hypothetical protein